MGIIFSADLGAMDALVAAHRAAGATITSAASVDPVTMLEAAATALGPHGAVFLAAHAPAQTDNVAAARLWGQIHTALGSKTASAKASIVAADSA